MIFERIERARNESTTLELSTSACDHTFPVCGAINSRFGPRHGRMHYGVDIDLEHGDTIVSAFEGVVRVSRYHRQFGHVVVVRHANGIETLYGHMSERKVEVGDHVEAGDLIGLGGSTGRSSGNHLHFETRYLGQPIDPQLLFNVQEGELRTSTLRVHPGLFAVENRVKSSPQGIHVVRRVIPSVPSLVGIALRFRRCARRTASAARPHFAWVSASVSERFFPGPATRITGVYMPDMRQ
ncbi:MAG TPA: M23 family metallopeptidase [Flavobacteriales bacterium]|nr:M23 family metallopeptidase [Flavobacteriales bacterium]